LTKYVSYDTIIIEVKIMKFISYVRLQKNYAGEYIARRGDKTLAHAKTYSQLVKKIACKHLDRTKLTIGLVPPKSTICIYAL